MSHDMAHLLAFIQFDLQRGHLDLDWERILPLATQAPLGMSYRTQQVTEEKHRKTSEKLCPSSGNYPIRPVSMEMASTCLDKPILRSIIIHHHPSSSPHPLPCSAVPSFPFPALSWVMVQIPMAPSKVPRTSAALGPLGVRSTRLMTNMTND